jgi:hypothetical protein
MRKKTGGFHKFLGKKAKVWKKIVDDDFVAEQKGGKRFVL